MTFNVGDTKFTVGYLEQPVFNKLQGLSRQAAAAAQQNNAQKATDYQNQYKELATRFDKHAYLRWQYGVNFSGKPTTNITNQLFQSSNSPASVSGGAYYGIHRLAAKTEKQQGEDAANGHPHHLRDDWFTLNGNYTKSTFDTIAVGATTATTQHFNGFNILPSYNALVDIKWFSFLWGVSGGVNRTNNSGDLDKVEIQTANATSGQISIVSQKDAYQGAYTASLGVPIYSDFVFTPKHLNWLSVDAFERSNVVAAVRYAEGGLGIFISKPNKPTDVLGGLSVGCKDGKSVISVVAGWTF